MITTDSLIKMDHDPDKPLTIEEEMAKARSNIERIGKPSEELSYWCGFYDGLKMAFELMQKKDG